MSISMKPTLTSFEQLRLDAQARIRIAAPRAGKSCSIQTRKPPPGKRGGTFWEIGGLSNVELVCGACGEYLKGFFDKK